jgi:hypothetical protein
LVGNPLDSASKEKKMKNIVCTIFGFLTIFYLVEYESYTWDPCQGNICLTINCPFEGCRADERHFFVKSIGEVRDIVEKNGHEHLSGMYRIEYDGKVTMHELKLVPTFDIQDAISIKLEGLTDAGTATTTEGLSELINSASQD